MSLATAGRGPLPIASAKKHHTSSCLLCSRVRRACGVTTSGTSIVVVELWLLFSSATVRLRTHPETVHPAVYTVIAIGSVIRFTVVHQSFRHIMKSDVGILKTTRQYRVVGLRQCSFQSATKSHADNRRNSHAIRWSSLTPRVVRRISTSSSAGCLLDCGPKRQGRELLRRRPCVPS